MNRILAASGLALAITAVSALSVPTETAAFSTIGGSLSLNQRDFRVYNNFTDSTANNNTTANADFPGALGAVMAIWKGHIEWASVPWAGAGDQDPSQNTLGSGGANFDNTYQGEKTAAGNQNGNRHSELSGSGGSTLAFTITPISDGWQILYYSSWQWKDGPGTGGSGTDLQGVACHEIGHSLGLGHSSTGGATMFASISGNGNGARSINSDDIAGVQFIYGVVSGGKPEITGVSGATGIGGVMNITGSEFSTSNNEVWFTEDNGDGIPVKVTGVSSTGGGTAISVTIPAGVADGEVQVKDSGGGNSALSNAWPSDIGAPAGDPPNLTSLNPTSGPAGGFTDVVISGSGFTGTNSVTFDGVAALSFNVDSGSQITATTPAGSQGSVDVEVSDPEGSSTLVNGYTYTADPTPNVDTINPSEGGSAGGTHVTISGTSVLGVTDVTFDGVSGTGLNLVDADTLNVTTPAGNVGAVDVVVIGNGSDTLFGGFTYLDQGQFIDIGPGIGGFLGAPVQAGSGDLSAGSQVGFTLSMSNALTFVPCTLFVSLSEGALPFKGGTFYPVPILLQIALVTDGTGGYALPAQIPAGTPSGLEFVLQTWVSDITAPQGSSGTNGLKAIVP